MIKKAATVNAYYEACRNTFGRTIQKLKLEKFQFVCVDPVLFTFWADRFPCLKNLSMKKTDHVSDAISSVELAFFYAHHFQPSLIDYSLYSECGLPAEKVVVKRVVVAEWYQLHDEINNHNLNPLVHESNQCEQPTSWSSTTSKTTSINNIRTESTLNKKLVHHFIDPSTVLLLWTPHKNFHLTIREQNLKHFFIDNDR